MRTVDDFKKEVGAHYTGLSLEITVDRDPTLNSSGNGIAYRSLYSMIVCLNQRQTIDDLNAFKACLAEREVGGPGLYHRNPNDKSRNGIDDYVYAAAASGMLESNRSVARAILNHYRTNRSFFDDQSPSNPDFAGCFARYVWFYGFLQLCAGEQLRWVDRLFLSAALIILPKKDDCGALLMSWVEAQVSIRAGGVLELLARGTLKRLAAMRPQGMSEICAEYFNRKGEEPHPFSWPEVWSGV